MTNIARFTIDGSASTNGGVDVSAGATVTLALEASPGVVAQRVVYSVYSSSDANAPLASKDAPTLTLDNGAGSTGQSVQASTPNASVTTTAPASGQHSYIVRCTVNGGVNTNGDIDADYVFERMICVRSGAGLRKTVYNEGTSYGTRGDADAQNELVDAYASATMPSGSSGQFITYSGGWVATDTVPGSSVAVSGFSGILSGNTTGQAALDTIDGIESIALTFTDDIVLGGDSANILETDASADKIGFFGATPVVQPVLTSYDLNDLVDALVDLGIIDLVIA